MNRRSFLKSCLILAAAPAIVRADSLMRIVVRDTRLILWGDGIHDDTEALQGYMDGLEVFRPSGHRIAGGEWLTPAGGSILICNTVYLTKNNAAVIGMNLLGRLPDDRPAFYVRNALNCVIEDLTFTPYAGPETAPSSPR